MPTRGVNWHFATIPERTCSNLAFCSFSWDSESIFNEAEGEEPAIKSVWGVGYQLCVRIAFEQ